MIYEMLEYGNPFKIRSFGNHSLNSGHREMRACCKNRAGAEEHDDVRRSTKSSVNKSCFLKELNKRPSCVYGSLRPWRENRTCSTE